jgi:hypothetical protein
VWNKDSDFKGWELEFSMAEISGIFEEFLGLISCFLICEILGIFKMFSCNWDEKEIFYKKTKKFPTFHSHNFHHIINPHAKESL